MKSKHEKIKMRIGQLNLILMSVLGSEKLIEKWWNSPNKEFNLNTPREIFAKEPKRVIEYILSHSRGDYS
ncbi:MAG: hypothetical protein EBU90_23425 [Proteobacteria bacterium]|nr:hypothetical protein [Pseudomonadota bacterium]